MNCNLAFIEQITKPLAEFIQYSRRVEAERTALGKKTPKKRFIVAFLVGYFISDITRMILDRVLPSHSGLSYDEQHQSEQAISRLQERANVTQLLHQAVGDSIKNMAEIIHQTDKRVSNLEHSIPEIIVTSNYLITKMIIKGTLIQRLKFAFKQNRLDLEALSELTENSWPENIDKSSVKLLGMASNSVTHMRMEFSARKRSNDTSVFKVNGFRHWINFTETPTLIEYTGPDYLIYNTSSNCVKAIDQPTTDYVTRNCEEQDFSDPRITKWSTVTITSDPKTVQASTKVVEQWPKLFIHCYPCWTPTRHLLIGLPETSSSDSGSLHPSRKSDGPAGKLNGQQQTALASL